MSEVATHTITYLPGARMDQAVCNQHLAAIPLPFQGWSSHQLKAHQRQADSLVKLLGRLGVHASAYLTHNGWVVKVAEQRAALDVHPRYGARYTALIAQLRGDQAGEGEQFLYWPATIYDLSRLSEHLFRCAQNELWLSAGETFPLFALQDPAQPE